VASRFVGKDLHREVILARVEQHLLWCATALYPRGISA
jgi:hypothetical protein